jgi:hypothetical protein
MLREYASGLDRYSSGRWDGLGSLARCDDGLAQCIGRSIADGEWPAGARLDQSLDKWYFRAHPRENVEGALRLLALRGEIDLRNGLYYVGSRDESS